MIKVGWGNTKQEYLIWQFQKGWQVTDYHQAFDTTASLLSSHKNMPIMVDLRNIGNANLLGMAYESLHYKTFLSNRIIFVGRLSIMHPVYALLAHVLIQKSINVSLVETMDEAYKMVMEEKSSQV